MTEQLTLREVAKRLHQQPMQCNCDLDNWEPERSTGFASPFTYAIEPTTPDTATWTAVIDASLTYYLNVSVTWGTSSSSNTITLKQLLLYGLN